MSCFSYHPQITPLIFGEGWSIPFLVLIWSFLIRSFIVFPSPKGRGGNVLVVHANLTPQKRPVYTVLRYSIYATFQSP